MADYLIMPPPASWPLMLPTGGAAVLQPSAAYSRLMTEGLFSSVAIVSAEHAAPGTGPVDEWPGGENYQPQMRNLTIPAPPIVGGAAENGWRVNPVFLAP